jgi:hypothetical protein
LQEASQKKKYYREKAKLGHITEGKAKLGHITGGKNKTHPYYRGYQSIYPSI